MAVRLHNIESKALGHFTLRKVRRIPELNDSDLRRFWAKVDRCAPDACWLWTGAGVPNGHGFLGLGKRPDYQPYYAHRIAWTITHGTIPDGIAVLHRCDVRRCCNASHLFLGTQGDNVRDASAKGHLMVSRPRGHKVTTEQLAQIDRLLADWVPQVRIAEQFGVSKAWISTYARGFRRQYDRPRQSSLEKAS